MLIVLVPATFAFFIKRSMVTAGVSAIASIIWLLIGVIGAGINV